MSGHTPGPWEQRTLMVVAPDGSTICHTGGTRYSGRTPLPHEAEANARLIAAAPETAAELERWKAKYDRAASVTPYDCTETLQAMRDAGHGDWADVLEDVSRSNGLREKLLQIRHDGDRHRLATQHLDLAIDQDRKRQNAEAKLERAREDIAELVEALEAAQQELHELTCSHYRREDEHSAECLDAQAALAKHARAKKQL